MIRPPADEDDTAYTEWDSDEPVMPHQVLEQIVDAIQSLSGCIGPPKLVALLLI
jgi:hypothetical protein